jgi:hypothetical protein
MELPYRILVFGSYSVGKTSLINLLTGAKFKTGNSANGNTFEFQEANCNYDNKKFLFVDTMGLSECLLSNEVNSYNKLRQFLKNTMEKGYNLIIHVKKVGSIDEVDKTNYDFVTKKLFTQKIQPVCVISFAESKMKDPKKWWIDNKNLFENNQMLYNDGVCVCLGHPDDPDMEEYFKKLRDKSRQLLWDVIMKNVQDEPIKLKLNIFDSLMQNLSKFFDSLNSLYDVTLTNSSRAIEQPYQRYASNELNILVVLNQKMCPISHFYDTFIKNQMNQSNSEPIIERENVIKVKNSSLALNFYFLNSKNLVPNKKYQEATTKFLFERFFNQMKPIYQNVNFNYFVSYPSKSCCLISNFIKNCLLKDIENNKLSSIFNIYDDEFEINFKALEKVNPREFYNFDFSDEFWEEICQRYNFRNDLDIGKKIDCELYECALMCFSLNNQLDDYQKNVIFYDKKWHDLFDSFEFNITLDNYKGITYFKKSTLFLRKFCYFYFYKSLIFYFT